MKKFLILVLCVLFVPFCCSCKKENKKPLTTYNMDLFLEDNILTGELKVNFVLQKNSYADFNFFANAYRQDAEFFALEKDDLPLEKKYGKAEILGVESVTLNKYELLKDNCLLRVFLNNKKGDNVQVKIEFKVALSNFSHRLSYGEDTINLGNFYPILCVLEEDYVFCPYYNVGDPFYSDVANYKVNFTCRGSFSVASSGICTGIKFNNDLTTYCFNLEKARDFALCLSKNFKIAKVNCNEVDVFYYYLTEDYQEELNIIKTALNYFGKFYAYPYKTYSVCQTDFCYGGMEYPGLVYINKTLNLKDRLYTIVHETAHQWWYSVVGNNQITNACLDEGLTEFASILFFKDNQNFNFAYKNLVSQKIASYSKFQNTYKQIYGLNYNFSPLRSLQEYKNSTDYVYTAYYYMPYMLYQLYNHNQTEFINNLIYFTKRYAFKNATLLDFVKCFNSQDKTFLNIVLQGKVV